MILTRNPFRDLARVATLIVAFSLCYSIVLAQETVPASDTAKHDCFRGRPLPDCDNFVISEIAYGRNSYGDPRIQDNYSSLEVGLMFNQSLRTAWGATLSQTWSEDNKLGANFRYRWWMNSYFHLDLAPGVWLSARDMSTYSFNNVGFTTRASVMYADAIGMEARFSTGEVFNLGPQTEWTWGIRAGSYVGAVIVVATLGLFLAYAAAAGGA